MPDLPVNAHIQEMPAEVKVGVEPTALDRQFGAYYPATLKWIPRVGDLIKLFSQIDAASGHEPTHYYEVVQVVHELSDYDEKRQGERAIAAQFVTIFVKPSNSRFFTS